MQNSEFRIGIADRSRDFGVLIIKLAKSLPRTPAGFAVASQIVRSGTSVGANLQEAKSASSRRDFIHCITISLKEARESYYWLTLIKDSNLLPGNEIELLLKENDEIIRILVTIVKRSKNNSELLTHNSEFK